MIRDVPYCDGLAGGAGGEFGGVGFRCAGCGVGVEGEFADLGHAELQFSLRPGAKSFDRAAGAEVFRMGFFEDGEDASGLGGGFAREGAVGWGVAR